jgi:hypothetical protein
MSFVELQSCTFSPSTHRPIYLISRVLKTGYAISTETNVSSSPTSPPNNPIFLAAGAIYYSHNKQVNRNWNQNRSPKSEPFRGKKTLSQ